jgi:succinate dehydrogenase/fumarate reductase cytochrome b subunit (b558 family)
MTRWVHSLAGLIPAAFFIPLHLWNHWAALAGRQAWVVRERALGTALPVALGVGLAASLLVHVALWPRGAETRPLHLLGSGSLRQFQRFSGIVALLFISYHFFHLAPATVGSDIFAAGSYDILWDSLGEPINLGIYLFGIWTLYFHLGHGLCRAAVTFDLVSSPRGALALRWTSASLVLLLWAITVQLVSYFATGTALIG